MVQYALRQLSMVSDKLTDDLDAGQLAVATKLIDDLIHPLGSDDIRYVMSLLPPDGDTAAGLNWTLVHAIEASPEWPIWEVLGGQGNEWVRILSLRLANAGIYPPAENGRQ